MKKVLILISLLLTSCSIYDGVMQAYSVDYKRYIDKGFYISPLDNIDGMKAMPIASIGVSYTDGTVSKTYEDLISHLVEMAIEKGANGILSLEIMTSVNSSGVKTKIVEGIAVKIEGMPELCTYFPNKVPSVYPVDSKDVKASPKSKIQLLGRYNFALAKASNKFYTKKKRGALVYYDPESSSYISREEFLKKYELWELEKLEKLY